MQITVASPLLALTLAPIVNGAIIVREVDATLRSTLQRREDQEFLGGWSLRSMVCPTGHEKCVYAKGMPACCPTGSVCNSDYIRFNDYVACCPKDQGCVSQLYSLPVCADSSWVLWQPWDSKKAEPWGTPFCCAKGQKGYLTTGDRTNPACGDPDVAVASSMLATTITPAGATGAASPGEAGKKATTTSSGDAASTNGNQKDGGSGESSSSDSSASSGLSSGAIGGIAVGAVLVAIAVAVGFWMMYRMGRRNGMDAVTGGSDAGAQQHCSHEANVGAAYGRYPQQQELGNGVVKDELAVVQNELDSRQYAELAENARQGR